jgi:hypothetical protein
MAYSLYNVDCEQIIKNVALHIHKICLSLDKFQSYVWIGAIGSTNDAPKFMLQRKKMNLRQALGQCGEGLINGNLST